MWTTSKKYKDYVCSAVTNGCTTKHPIQNKLSYKKFTQKYQQCVKKAENEHEPANYNEAIAHKEWKEAMSEELNALNKNKTWDLVQLPQNRRPIGSKWVYKIKYKSDGMVERYKARLVARGFSQIEGIDYNETFAPVAKLVIVKALIAIASTKRWQLHQMDVHNAFLQGDLEEEIYMKPP